MTRREQFKQKFEPKKTDALGQKLPSYSVIKDFMWTKSMSELDSLIGIYRELRQIAIDNAPYYPPNKFEERGIVICAGGSRYFTCAYVLINLLKELGCTLPIEVWYRTKTEMTSEMIDILKKLGVDLVCAGDVYKTHPERILDGWGCKVYAIIHSRFKEVMFIDCDNVPTKDPTYLFDTKEYKETGSLFWPDYQRLDSSRAIWRICDVPYKDEEEFETGQIVVNKEKCWKELQLTMHMNAHSDFYYKHVHGDKETFHMAWKILGTPYTMVPYPIKKLPEIGPSRVMCQHDLDGNIIFQHRNMDKWNLAGNLHIKNFVHEDKCFKYLNELNSIWSKDVSQVELSNKAFELKQLLIDNVYKINLANKWGNYIKFNSTGEVVGAFGYEKTWYIEELGDDVFLVIFDHSRPCYRLKWISKHNYWTGMRLDNAMEVNIRQK